MNGSKQRLRRILIVTAMLAVLAGGAAWAFCHVGQWLVVEDQLESAQAIVVLSGGMPVRAREAAEIYRQGFAAQVWVTRPVGPAEELQQMDIPYLGEEYYSRKILIYLGVPADAIHILEKPVVNTEEEVLEIAAELRRGEGRKVIVVTAKPHTRRVKAIWKARVGESPRALVRYASGDDYDGARWWRRTHDALAVVREILGLANAWAGFPVRPAGR
jgi:uncharacterized SAM-binding protein YcdF (DUF218 family)